MATRESFENWMKTNLCYEEACKYKEKTEPVSHVLIPEDKLDSSTKIIKYSDIDGIKHRFTIHDIVNMDRDFSTPYFSITFKDGERAFFQNYKYDLIMEIMNTPSIKKKECPVIKFKKFATLPKCGGAFDIKNVEFNPPLTVVIWEDGSKTFVKCDGETYDPEKGLAMAIAKKALGNKFKSTQIIGEWVDKKWDEESHRDEPIIQDSCDDCKKISGVHVYSDDEYSWHIEPNHLTQTHNLVVVKKEGADED